MLGQMHSLQEIYLEDNNELEVCFAAASLRAWPAALSVSETTCSACVILLCTLW